MRNTGLVVLVLAALLSLSSTVEAQQAGKVYGVGYLTRGESAGPPPGLDAFRERLQEPGWTTGPNVALEIRFAEAQDLPLSTSRR